MGADNTISVQDNCVLHEMRGEALEAAEILQSMKDVLALCREHNIKNVLTHRKVAAKQKAGEIDFFQFGKFLTSQDLSGYKFALVFPEETHGDKIKFFETVGVNRGINIKLFSAKDDAENWFAQ